MKMRGYFFLSVTVLFLIFYGLLLGINSSEKLPKTLKIKSNNGDFVGEKLRHENSTNVSHYLFGVPQNNLNEINSAIETIENNIVKNNYIWKANSNTITVDEMMQFRSLLKRRDALFEVKVNRLLEDG